MSTRISPPSHPKTAEPSLRKRFPIVSALFIICSNTFVACKEMPHFAHFFLSFSNFSVYRHAMACHFRFVFRFWKAYIFILLWGLEWIENSITYLRIRFFHFLSFSQWNILIRQDVSNFSITKCLNEQRLVSFFATIILSTSMHFCIYFINTEY